MSVTTLLGRMPRLPLDASDSEITARALMILTATGGMGGGHKREIKVLAHLPLQIDLDMTDEEIAAEGPADPVHWVVMCRRVDGDTKGDRVTAEITRRPEPSPPHQAKRNE